MTVGELIQRLRILLNDTQAIEFSDGELIGHINQAQDYIVQTAVNLGFQGFIKKTTLTLTDGSSPLPVDFIREYSVVAGKYILNAVPPDAEISPKTYKIVGDKIFSRNDTLDLYYFFQPAYYTATTDVIQLPAVFNNLLMEIVVYLAKNRIELAGMDIQLASLYEQKIAQIVSAYGNAFIERPMPF